MSNLKVDAELQLDSSEFQVFAGYYLPVAIWPDALADCYKLQFTISDLS